MAKKTDKSEVAPAPTGHRRFLRYSMVLGLIGVVVLLWISLLTYSPTDPPARWISPPPPVHNAIGLAGSHVAYAVRYWIGAGAYMGLMFASIAGVLMLIGGRIGDLPWRIIGVVLMAVSTSAACHLIRPVIEGDLAAGNAGVLGAALGEMLLDRFSGLGSWIVIGVALLIGLMLAADNLVLRLPSLGRKAWSNRGQLTDVLKSIRWRRDGESPATVGGPMPAAPRAIAAAPAGKAGAMVRPSSARAAAPRPVAKPRSDVPVAATSPAAPASPPAGSTDAARRPEQISPPANPAAPARVALPRPRPAAAKPLAPRPTQVGDFKLPSTELLAEPTGGYLESQEAQAAQKRAVLQQTLTDFNVQAEVVGHMTGPVITMFELSLAPGVKVAAVSNLANDIARTLAVPGVRVVSPLPGKDTIGIEVPNMDKEIVRLKELMALSPEAEKKMRLPMYLGKDASGAPIISDLSDMPHMLIAGTTGSGKSVCINSIILALLMTRSPQDVRFILIDPKMVEMAAFDHLPHLLCPIVNDMRHAEDILEWATVKMDERYELLKEAGVKNIAAFNRLDKEEIYKRFNVNTDEERAKVLTHLPYYVVVVDELADLIMTSSKEVESHIIRIAQKARAVGIHLILATQRPSVNVVTGLIKSNMPCRISFRVSSRQESRIVLDQNGADVLLGRGDMLFLQPGESHLSRAQGTFVDDAEIRAVVQELRQASQPNYDNELVRLNERGGDQMPGEKDEMFDKAVEIVLASQRGSVSLLQRRLQVGYSRASRIIDQMAEAGILGEYKGSQARECMMTLEDWQSLKGAQVADETGESASNGEPTSV